MSSSRDKPVEEILRLKRELNAVILAHNYQPAEVQEIADFVGDSLELSIEAMRTDAKVIVFAGVDFMAEQAKILNPDKIVLIPDVQARCHMANMLTPEMVRKAREKFSKPIVLYVNTLASCKALADYICTSANVVDVVSRIDSDEVILGPDANLAAYASWRTGKVVHPLPENGHCYVHKLFRPEPILELKRKLEEEQGSGKVVFIAHPECDLDVLKIADHVGSTSQMVRYVKNVHGKVVIFATEVDMIHRLRRESPDNVYVPANSWAYCIYMKQHSLEKILRCLREKRYVVELDRAVIKKSQEAIMRTFELLGMLDKLGLRK